MKRSRSSEEQVIGILREARAGKSVGTPGWLIDLLTHKPENGFLDRINKMDKIAGKAFAKNGVEIFLSTAHPQLINPVNLVNPV